eukprot:366311-Chlamydomonas_euryale.AAC.6
MARSWNSSQIKPNKPARHPWGHVASPTNHVLEWGTTSCSSAPRRSHVPLSPPRHTASRVALSVTLTQRAATPSGTLQNASTCDWLCRHLYRPASVPSPRGTSMDRHARSCVDSNWAARDSSS